MVVGIDSLQELSSCRAGHYSASLHSHIPVIAAILQPMLSVSNLYLCRYDKYKTAIDVVRDTGAAYIVDEGGDGDEAFRNTSAYGTYLALMHTAAINAGASGVTMWLYRDQYYVWPLEDSNGHDSFYHGLHRWGTEPWLPYASDVRPSWYAATLLMTHMGPPHAQAPLGAKSVETSGEVEAIAIAAVRSAAVSVGHQMKTNERNVGKNDGCDRSIVMVNGGSESKSIKVTLMAYTPSACTEHNQTLFRYLYNPADVPVDAKPIGSSGSTNPLESNFVLTDNIPPGGMVVWATLGTATR
eukprot:m.1336508 g.1336508  ORF g.1336508 m.1336508 type:complete len:298 (+) comp24880_c0_seq5:1907-2800(+)